MNYEHEKYGQYLVRRFGPQAGAVLATLTICLLAGLVG